MMGSTCTACSPEMLVPLSDLASAYLSLVSSRYADNLSNTDGARSSRVPIPLPDDPNMAVRQAYLATIIDSESEPFKDSRETEIPQPLPIASSPVKPSNDPYLIVGQAHTPAAIDTESKPEEAPSETEEFQPLFAKTTPPSSDHTPTSSDHTPVSPLTNEEFEASEPSNTRITSSHYTAPSDSTTPLSPDHLLTQTAPTPTLSRPLYHRRTARMAVRTQPAMSPGLSARVTEVITLSPSSFRKMYISSYETPSSSASPASSPTLPIRKRYRGTSELILDTETKDDESKAMGASSEREESEDEGPDSKGEEAALERQQQQAALVEVTTADRPLGLGYGAARRRALELAEEITPSNFEIGQSSRSVSDQQVADRTPTPRIPARTIWIYPKDGTIYLDIKINPRSCALVKTLESPEWSSDSLPISPSSLTVSTLVAPPVDSSPVASPATVEAESFLAELGAQNTTMQSELQELQDHVTTLEREVSRRGQ
ncbi:hypothetical protein Tco_1304156 [Tanacetum coccineum]